MALSSEHRVESNDAISEAEFIDHASGNVDPAPPIKGVNRLLVSILPANLGIFLVWGSVPGILLPQQVATTLGEADKVANLALIATIGAAFAMIAQPLAGQISDRTRSRFGRRAPWIMIGGLAGALSLVGMGFANSLVGIVIAWALVQVTFNFAQGPLSAVMPDRVPLNRRGTFATMSGIGLMAGALGGQIIAVQFLQNLTLGYIVFALIAIVLLGLFVILNPDYSSEQLRPEPFDLIEFLRTFWVNPVKHPDFFWAFTGRLLLFTGYFLITGFQFYTLTDYIGIEDPATVIPGLAMLNLAGVVIATVISGPLSDKLGRRKVFVFASSVVVGVAFMLPWLSPTIGAWTIMTAVSGFGFGMFQAVDTALMSQVLPSAKSFAKDLGVVNIAATLPQTLAPGLAGALVLAFGYAALFPVGALLGVLGAFAVWPIRSAR